MGGPKHALRLAAAAVELSGEWRTAMFLDDQRADGVPGNFLLEFEADGSVRGTGTDSFGDFVLDGFWTSRMWLLRKSSNSRGYSVDLIGFFDEDGSVHGAWLFNTRAAGFWAC